MHIDLHTSSGEKHSLEAAPGQSLAQAVWLSGQTTPPPLCSGLGRCCRCRVRFLSLPPPPFPADIQSFSADELKEGWRLACRHALESLAQPVTLFLPPQPVPLFTRTTDHAPKGKLLLAVDLGTTSLHWHACDETGQSVAQGQEINPQMGAGSEVMSRLAVARRPDGLARLSTLVQDALRRVIAGLPGPVREICVAANTAMIAILLQKDVESLARAPYAVPFSGDAVEHLPGLPPIYIPPQPAPFVGGDVSAGIIALLKKHSPVFPFLFADLGTNGEFVLGLGPEQYFLASVPMGPALEGIGLSCGDMAGPGAATAFMLTPGGLSAATFDGAPPTRICGTGYLSLIHVLLRAGVLNTDGTFCSHPPHPLGRKLGAQVRVLHGEASLPLPGGLALTAGDVEEILKVKAAFSLALEQLLKAGNSSAAALSAIYLSGSLGSHAPVGDLEALGFLPQGSGPRLRALGNTSLDGAQWLLRHPEARSELARWSRCCHVVDLASSSDFTQYYLRHMRFA